MYRVAMVHAYDAMDAVVVSAHVRESEGVPGEQLEPALTVSITVRGTGEPEVAVWLRDALVALAETL